MFLVNVATDLGQGKLNTGIAFTSKPQALQPVFAAVNELYTAERQSLLRDTTSRFSTVLGLILSKTSNSKEKWSELTSVTQLSDGCQIYVFDGDSPPPERGVIPKATLVVNANSISNQASLPRTPSVSEPPVQHNPPVESNDAPHHGRSAAREFLFEELCRHDQAGSGHSFPTQALHSVLVQNDMFFSTSDFSQMTHHRVSLNHNDWLELCSEFSPVVDVLYDRIAAKSRNLSQHQNARDKEKAARQIKDKLDELADEEAALLAKQAEIRDQKAKLRRLLGNMEAEAKAEKDDRSKEWDVVCKFVNLRIRQTKLREEDQSIAHQLSLL